MERMTWYEAKHYLTEYNRKRCIRSKGICENICQMVAVISEDSFDQKYSLEERSYVFTNDNKAFIDGMGGYSIYAGSMDGSDPCVRLEAYVEGPKPMWRVEYCYILKED